MAIKNYKNKGINSNSSNLSINFSISLGIITAMIMILTLIMGNGAITKSMITGIGASLSSIAHIRMNVSSLGSYTSLIMVIFSNQFHTILSQILTLRIPQI